MNSTFQASGSTAFVVLTSILAIVTTIFWMIVGWRAMRAHERIADATERKP
jgi:uncharacterized membrane protein